MFSTVALYPLMLGVASAPPALPPHPRLMLTSAEVRAVKERVERLPWAQAAYDVERRVADSWLNRN
ncbi:MAG: hypothetical protein QHJ73_06895, partial [Armatimonadota bacterium]|nr:hypothetical protein [Armatimonadota bacterium]